MMHRCTTPSLRVHSLRVHSLRVHSLRVHSLRVGTWARVFVTAALATALGAGCGAAQQESGGRISPDRNPAGPTASPRHDRDSDSEPTVVEGRPPSMQERRLINHLIIRAEQTRHLSFQRAVPIRIQTREQALRHLFRELDDEELEKTRRVYVALGLLPEDLNVRLLLERVLGEQVAGYYDQDLHQLVVRDEVLEALHRGDPEEEAQVAPTILHELIHALQDQRLDLSEDRIPEDESDAQSAYQSLIEGDATLAMLAYVIEAQGVPLSLLTQEPARIRGFAQEASVGSSESELRNAPAILRVTLLSSYFDGLMFCATLHRHGGWQAIDRAHREPPVSTEQVLHPERYLLGEVPDAVEVPALSGLIAAGYEVVHTDRLGELEFRVYFGQHEDGTDETAADGWSGDQLVAFGAGEQLGIVWFSAWDDEQEAVEAETAAQRVQGSGEGLVKRAGRGLLIVRHIPQRFHRGIQQAFLRFAQGLPKTPPNPPEP